MSFVSLIDVWLDRAASLLVGEVPRHSVEGGGMSREELHAVKWIRRGAITGFFLIACSIIAAGGVAAQEANIEAGKQLYQQRCSPCHGPDGKANIPTAQALNPKPRDHTDGAYMNQLSTDHLTKVIKQGGAAVGKSPIMPPSADLNDQQLRDVVAFVRTLASPPYKGN